LPQRALPETVKRSSVPDIEIATLDRVEIVLEPWSWPFAAARRDEIDRHFAALQRQRSGIWNGRILLMHRWAIDDRVLRGACFESDYASLCAWRDWNHPDRGVHNFFAAAALRSSDGAYLVGEMAGDTAAAGLLNFPCGTPEPDDIDAHGRFDIGANLGRELLEETGIAVAELACEPGWTVVRDGGFVGLVKLATARQRADELRARIMRYLANEARPEFTDIRIVRDPADLGPPMPPFMIAFLDAMWRQ
jgi:8-oxo-dGTP pyrophosphatase MutT (NUDIX family)